MTQNKQLKQQATEINDLLTEQIAVNDELFRFSVRKAIPLPFIFKKIDYSALHERAAQALEHSQSVAQNLEEIEVEIDESEDKFYRALREYHNSLTHVFDCLVMILDKLKRKAADGYDYPHRYHQQDVEEYERVKEHCYKLGKQLQQQYELVS